MKKFFFVILVLALAAFFRLYNIENLQYWSVDEEIAAATVYRMVSLKTISFVSFNTNLGASLGSFFHILSVPLFLISSLNPTKILLLSSLLGLGTTVLVFLTGRMIKGFYFGLLVSFLYACSFLIGLFDRRWWPLTPNPLLCSLALFSILKILMEKKYIYLVSLAASIGFAFHSDPSLLVLPVASLGLIVFYRPKIPVKFLVSGLAVVSLFLSPLVFFEIRHPGTIIKPLFNNVTKQGSQPVKLSFNGSQFSLAAGTVGRLIAPQASNYLESQFSWAGDPQKPLLSPLPESIGLILIILPLVLFCRQKPVVVLGSFLAAFFAGTTLYGLFSGKNIHQHYFTVLFPVFIVLMSYSLDLLFGKRKGILVVCLAGYLLLNLYALVNSGFKYPLSEKLALVEKLSAGIGTTNFSLDAPGTIDINGGGFTELFILNGKSPLKSYIYPYYDWMYKAHGLYTVTPTTADQKLSVTISDRNNDGNLEGEIKENSL